MWTVTQLARECGLSRGTLLYYESIGLMPKVRRTSGNYRKYGDEELARLRQIVAYRDAGLKLADIGAIVNRRGGPASEVLKRRLAEIEREVAHLREHQRSILRLLQIRSFRRKDMVTKEKFVGVLRAAGFSEAEMQRLHAEFEKTAPAEHQEFLEFLHIPADEIARIREWSRGGKKE